MMRESVRRFAQAEIAPRVKTMDASSELDPQLLSQLFAQGLMGIEVSEELGGAGLSFTAACIAVEELARVDPAISVVVDVQNTLVCTAIRKWGNAEQQKRYLSRLASDTVGSFCLSEASSGSDAFAMKSTATRDGSEFVLNGTKLWITNAQQAGLFLVLANVNPQLGYKGITAFVVERGNPGLKIGKKEDKLGIRASSTCEVILDECRVSEDAVIGEIGKGYKIAIESLNEGRIGIGAQMLGLAQGAFDYAMPYLQQRTQFGQRIGDFQGMQFQYARAAMEIQAARNFVYEGCRLVESGKPCAKEAAYAKLYASEVASRVATQCIEWLGGVGFTKEYDAEKFYRDCIVGKIYEGTSNMQLQGIAKILQREYAQ